MCMTQKKSKKKNPTTTTKAPKQNKIKRKKGEGGVTYKREKISGENDCYNDGGKCNI